MFKWGSIFPQTKGVKKMFKTTTWSNNNSIWQIYGQKHLKTPPVDALPAAENDRFIHCHVGLWKNCFPSHWIPWYFTEGIWSLHYYIERWLSHTNHLHCTKNLPRKVGHTFGQKARHQSSNLSDFPMSSPQRATNVWLFQESWGDSEKHSIRDPNLCHDPSPPRFKKQAPIESGTQLLRQSSLQNFHQPIILPGRFETLEKTSSKLVYIIRIQKKTHSDLVFPI